MRTRRIPHVFSFTSADRPDVTLGAGTRLHPQDHVLQLYGTEEQGNATFPTTADLTVRTRVFSPTSVKQWVGFDANIANVIDTDTQTTVTGANYRLNDGTDDRWWDGAAWSVAGASDWNTEAEIAANIATFPVASRTMQIVINPWTTNSLYTPKIREIRLLFRSNIDEVEDLIARSFIPKLRSDVRPIADLPIKYAGGTTIDLANDYPLETPYNIVDIDMVYDYDNDPNGLVDLLSIYDSGTKVITLTGSLPADTRVWIRFLYEPEIAITTSQEFYELAKIPAIILRDTNAVDSAENGQATYVRNKGAGTAVTIPGARQVDLDMVIECVTDKQKDLLRLSQAIEQFFGKNTYITSLGLDRKYRLWLIDEYDGRTQASQSDLHTCRFRARIVDALFFDGPEEDAYAVERFHITGDANTVIS